MQCHVDDEPDGLHIELVNLDGGGYSLRHLLTEEWVDIAAAGDIVHLDIVDGWAVVHKNGQAAPARSNIKSSVHTGEDRLMHIRPGGLCTHLNVLRRRYKVVAGVLCDTGLKYKVVRCIVCPLCRTNPPSPYPKAYDIITLVARLALLILRHALPD